MSITYAVSFNGCIYTYTYIKTKYQILGRGDLSSSLQIRCDRNIVVPYLAQQIVRKNITLPVCRLFVVQEYGILMLLHTQTATHHPRIPL